MQALERLTMVMTLARRLEEVLDAETGLLRRMEVDQIERLQDEKASLADAYERETRALRTAPEILGSLDMEVRRSFEAAVRKLQESGRRNEQAVEAARRVVEKIVSRLGRTVAEQAGEPQGYGPGRPSHPGYGALGAQHAPIASSGRPAGRVIAVAFNQQV